MYQALKPARSEWMAVRQYRYHTWQWGKPGDDRPPLVLLHGWMDVGASFQFVVDALADDRWIVAPDWRGYGLTQGPATDSYWFADYLGDLDALLDLLDRQTGAQPVDLVGHSMGGNVAMMYAGVRPARIRRLVSLEGFGLPATRPAQAPRRYARWLDELRTQRQGELRLRDYADVGEVARRLMRNNPRLTPDKAEWLASHWAAPDPEGRWQVRGDPAHKVTSATLYRVEEVLAVWSAIAAPTLSVTASDDSMATWWKGQYTLQEYHERLRVVPRVEHATVADAGHMLHHDQPQALADVLQRFLA